MQTVLFVPQVDHWDVHCYMIGFVVKEQRQFVIIQAVTGEQFIEYKRRVVYL